MKEFYISNLDKDKDLVVSDEAGKCYILSEQRQLFCEDTYSVSRYIATSIDDASSGAIIFSFAFFVNSETMVVAYLDEAASVSFIEEHVKDFAMGQALSALRMLNLDAEKKRRRL